VSYGVSLHDAACLVTQLCLSGSVIAVYQLTESLIITCYHYQHRSARNTSIDIKAAIEQLRSLSDVLHGLLALDGEDLNGSPQSSSASILNLICTQDGPLVQCTTELRTLEKLMETGGSPVSEADLIQTLENLEKIKVVLTANKRLVRNHRPQGCTKRGSEPLYRAAPSNFKAPNEIVMSAY
jgi:hypothetical protein